MTTTASDLLSAIAFAADKHRDQRRKDAAASPYINHPIALTQPKARGIAGQGRVQAVLRGQL